MGERPQDGDLGASDEDLCGVQEQPAKQSDARGILSMDVGEVLVQKVPVQVLEQTGERKRTMWKAHLSHLLDGFSALFSLACGSASLACLGFIEWSTLATIVVLIGCYPQPSAA